MKSLAKTVRAARRGDIGAFGRLVDLCHDAVYGTALALLGNPHDAEDAAQDSFVSAWEKLKGLRTPEKFPQWVCRIARNRCLDFLRRDARKTASLARTAGAPSAQASPDPAHQAEKRDIQEKVVTAVRSLSRPLRLATTLFYINGYSTSQVADFLNVPVGTVKRRLHSARRQLKERMIAMVEKELRGTRPGPDSKKRIISRIQRIEVCPAKSSPHTGLVLLVDDKGRSLIIMVGKTEAMAVWRGLSSAPTPRPQTHELFAAALRAWGIELKEARIVDLLEDGTFIGELRLQKGRATRRVDCRPSDALALATMSGAKITVSEHVMARASVRTRDGKPVQAVNAWRETPEGKLALRTIEKCVRLVEISDADFGTLVETVGVEQVLLAFAFANVLDESADLWKRVAEKLSRVRAEPPGGWQPASATVTQPGLIPGVKRILNRTSEVAKAQDAISAALEPRAGS